MVLLKKFEPNEQGAVAGGKRLPRLALAWGKFTELETVQRIQTQGLRKTVYLLITITVLLLSHPHLAAQEVTSQAPPVVQLPDAPAAESYPDAVVLPATDKTEQAVLESDRQSKTGSVYTLDGDVVITYGSYKVEADHIDYNSDTGELNATGRVKLSGGPDQEIIHASRGTMNLATETGRFYDVSGSVGVKQGGAGKSIYVSNNPFVFTGQVVVKTGPESYQIYYGTLTSCQLAHPDWLLSAALFKVNGEMATAKSSTFRLFNLPLLYLPYVTHPVDVGGRQSGFLIPNPGNSSTKGISLGEEFYWAINRSMDLRVGLDYYSLRGWGESAQFRYRGLGNDFATARYVGLVDRGIEIGGVFVNQGGQDVLAAGRHDFDAHTRVAGNLEYLSSYTYREAFTENFNQAVSSDILSIIYGVHEQHGYAESLRADRYQGLKQVAVPATETAPAIPEEQIKIFHVPALDFNSTEHELGTSGLQWSMDSSFGGLSRVQPKFASGGLTQRVDLHPQLAYPIGVGGWHFRPSVAVRDTLYSRSQRPKTGPGPPVELPNGINRADVELGMDLRPPVVERTFDSASVERLFHHDIRHTIEPEFNYRYVEGVDNFSKVLRFDDTDIVSDTNELEYGLTQRLFLRPVKNKPCDAKQAAEDTELNADEDWETEPSAGSQEPTGKQNCNSREWITWRLAQKYFFDERFGGAIVNGRRNIFDTTLNFSGIAFLTEPRAISPLVSRLRVRTSDHLDFEWDFDFDTGAKKFTSDNVLVNLHEGNIFSGLSYARLNAPGRFYSEGVSSAVSNFSQLRLLMGYGSPVKPGFSVAANVGLDLNQLTSNAGLVQYGALQTSYNWNCCGVSVEYQKFELGSVRNESVERFNFTLVNIGTAGNLRKTMRLF